MFCLAHLHGCGKLQNSRSGVEFCALTCLWSLCKSSLLQWTGYKRKRLSVSITMSLHAMLSFACFCGSHLKRQTTTCLDILSQHGKFFHRCLVQIGNTKTTPPPIHNSKFLITLTWRVSPPILTEHTNK